MQDVDAFVAAVVPRLVAEVEAIHDGDLGPRLALWSRRDPVTLFGAILTASGWREVGPAFQWLASTFTGGSSIEYEVVAADVHGDLGYVVGIEHSVAARGGEQTSYALRVTTVLRREEGEWKVVHRHGDRFDPASREQVARLAALTER